MADNNSNSNQFKNQLKELDKDTAKTQKDAQKLRRRVMAAKKSGAFFEAQESEARPGTQERKAERGEEAKTVYRERRQEFTVFRRVEHRDRQRVYEEMEQVRKELLMAIKQMNEMRSQIREVERTAFENVPNPGVYHLNFFEKLKNMLKVFHQNMKDSNNWLDMVFSRKNKKRYWSRAKKGGAGYMLSGERRIATQAG